MQPTFSMLKNHLQTFCLCILLIYWGSNCNTAPHSDKDTAVHRTNTSDSLLNKRVYDCSCGWGNKTWLDKPFVAIVNADEVLVRWHPFSPKVLRVVNKGDQLVVNAVFNYQNQHGFALLTRDTFAIFNTDSLPIHKGRRAELIWEDTVANSVKVRFMKVNSSNDYFYNDKDTSFTMVLNKSDIEILPNSRWYYLKTADNTDACILGKYLDLTEK